MRRVALLVLTLVPFAARAQQVTIATRGSGHAAALIDSVVAAPHAVRGGQGPLVLPRDSVITSSLLVVGRQTYLASSVRGDVVVVGGDLFLRPGASVSGRAVAIGGTVSETTLGHVAGGVQSLRDETFLIRQGDHADAYTLSAQSLRIGGDDATPKLFRLSGLYGVKLPGYDRVDGLSLPVGAQLVLPGERAILEPTLTYRSRLGVVDPGISLLVGADSGTRFEGRLARDTRSNDSWITSDLVNSLKSLAFGTDTRNYFRTDIAEGRVFVSAGGDRAKFEPYAGVRVERVSPISGAGNVFSFTDRHDALKMARPNPLVERGTIGSLLVGAVYESRPTDAPMTSRLAVDAEQSLTTPDGTSRFTQLTADGRLEFPTFSTQRLRLRAHAVGTVGDSVPRARYAYLGGSRTLGLSDLLKFGGGQLVFIESRYLIPIEAVQLPKVGPPTFSLIHRIGGAGVHSISPLQQEVGASIGIGSHGAGIDVEFMTGASGQGRSDIGVSISLPIS